MKNKRSAIVISLSVLVAVSGILSAIGILLIPAVIGTPTTEAQENISGIEYSPLPENTTILITAEKGEGVLLNLDFSDIVTNIYIFEQNAKESAEAMGFIVDRTVEIDTAFLLAFCDRLGGIELEVDGKKLKYFSASLEEFLSGKPKQDKMLQICDSFFEKFAKTGLSSGDFMFIIENSKTDLNYPICYDWIEYIPEMFCNCVYQ